MALDGRNERLRRENRALREQLESRHRLAGLSTSNARMAAAINLAARAAQSRATVLIRGESGTGKELVARGLHYESARRDLPFMEVNCAAITERSFGVPDGVGVRAKVHFVRSGEISRIPVQDGRQ